MEKTFNKKLAFKKIADLICADYDNLTLRKKVEDKICEILAAHPELLLVQDEYNETVGKRNLGMIAAEHGFSKIAMMTAKDPKAAAVQDVLGNNVGMYAANAGMEYVVLETLNNSLASAEQNYWDRDTVGILGAKNQMVNATIKGLDSKAVLVQNKDGYNLAMIFAEKYENPNSKIYVEVIKKAMQNEELAKQVNKKGETLEDIVQKRIIAVKATQGYDKKVDGVLNEYDASVPLNLVNEAFVRLADIVTVSYFDKDRKNEVEERLIKIVRKCPYILTVQETDSPKRNLGMLAIENGFDKLAEFALSIPQSATMQDAFGNNMGMYAAYNKKPGLVLKALENPTALMQQNADGYNMAMVAGWWLRSLPEAEYVKVMKKATLNPAVVMQKTKDGTTVLDILENVENKRKANQKYIEQQTKLVEEEFAR